MSASQNQLDAAQLMAEARKQTGLADFGEDYFREPLERLVASINAESKLSELGKISVPASIIRNLTTRLAIEEWYHRHPEIDDQEIVAPLFIIGLPRTGTTALGHMLGLDPQTRSLRLWEADQPCPPPEAATQDSDPRIAVTQSQLDNLLQHMPTLHQFLPRQATAAEECWPLMNLSFMSLANEGFMHVPSYITWIQSASVDMTPAFRYHKRVLKLLQWRCPPTRWQLRNPSHMYAMEALNTVYPDARFVMTHRDPAKAMLSISSLVYESRKPSLEQAFPKETARSQVAGWECALERALKFRDRVGESRFFDISHRDQVQNPVPQIRALYAWLRWSFDGMEARIRQWSKSNPKGTHKPDPEFFGLNLDEIRQDFRFYTDRFKAAL